MARYVGDATWFCIAGVVVSTWPPQFSDVALFWLLSLAAAPALAVRWRARQHRHDHHHRLVEPPHAELVELLRSSPAPSAP